MLNVPNLSAAFSYLHTIVCERMRAHLQLEESEETNEVTYLQDDSPFARLIRTHQPTFEEYIVLLLALVPHVQPHFFNRIMAEFLPEGGDLPEFGGVRGTNHRGIMPTGETAQFILAGDDLTKRLEIQGLFSASHWFLQRHILKLESVREGEPAMSGRLLPDSDIVELLTLGSVSPPRFSTDFPAERITTQLEWSDLILHPQTLHQIRDLENWMRWNDTLLQEWEMKKQVKQGYRSLFYGPPGTGKTLTATLLGKYTDKEVYRVDLSQTVSKYIGETEKNLSKLFDKAENKNWILFFDEADALFGKRTEVRDAHDKYANQEVAYLLQRIEAYNGLVILASNQRTNIDEAFTRRFQSVIHFPFPRAEERLALWQKALPTRPGLADTVDWPQIAARFELTGANIVNVMQYSLLTMLANGKQALDYRQIETGIVRELVKEGKLS
ncbi:MAG: ATP-binding protein [Spirosomataceae bacterium]